MSNLTQRIITGIIGVSIMIGAILFSEYTLLLLLLLISVLGLLEFYRLCENDSIQPQKAIGILTAAVLFVPLILSSLLSIHLNLVPLLIILPYLIFIRELYTKSTKPFTNIAYTLLGVIYISVPLFLFYLTSVNNDAGNDTYHPKIILGYLFILWASDTGAYFAGRSLGRHKLFERISPKKTWEGSVGGTILAFLVAFIISKYYVDLSLKDWLVITVIIVVTGTLGDLVESLFKRSIHIKDSGEILPGHGGILDRFDALFISAPFVFFYFLMSR